MTDYLRSPLFQLKVGELILSLICTGLFFASDFPSSSVLLTQITDLTLFGFILLNCVVIISVVTQEPLSRTLFLIISGAGAVLFLVSGIIILITYFKSGTPIKYLIGGFIAIVNSIVYGGDTYYIIMYFEG